MTDAQESGLIEAIGWKSEITNIYHYKLANLQSSIEHYPFSAWCQQEGHTYLDKTAAET